MQKITVSLIVVVLGFGILLVAYSLHTVLDTIDSEGTAESLTTDEDRLERADVYFRTALMTLCGAFLILGSVIALFLSYISPTRTKKEPSEDK